MNIKSIAYIFLFLFSSNALSADVTVKDLSLSCQYLVSLSPDGAELKDEFKNKLSSDLCKNIMNSTVTALYMSAKLSKSKPLICFDFKQSDDKVAEELVYYLDKINNSNSAYLETSAFFLEKYKC